MVIHRKFIMYQAFELFPQFLAYSAIVTLFLRHRDSVHVRTGQPLHQ